MTNDISYRGYFERRIYEELGATPDDLKLSVYNPEAEFPIPEWQDIDCIYPCKEGFRIKYYTITGELRQYYTDAKTPKLVTYEQIRLQYPKTDNDKYKLPWGQTPTPFFPPSLVNAFREGKKLKQLFITEGALSALGGSIHLGIYVVGLTSISHYRDPKTQRLHRDIELLIERCEVEQVIILWDGDCRNISEKDLKAEEDIAIRPNLFYSAAKNIAQLISRIPFEKGREKASCYFAHVRPESFTERPKGLDDIATAARIAGKLDVVSNNIQSLRKSNYFFFTNITKDRKPLRRYFGLHDVETFYQIHGDVITTKRFNFFGDTAYYSETEEKLIIVAPKWAKELYWVRDYFYQDLSEPTQNGVHNRILKEIKASTLVKRFGEHFYRKVAYYDGFLNWPQHGDSYQRIIEDNNRRFLNIYNPFIHKAKKGDFPTIVKFFEHIFGSGHVTHKETGEKVSQLDLGFDYVQLLLQNPNRHLPILCLYSPENSTGKSTLGFFLAELFKDNVIFLSNQDLVSEFNTTYANKLVAICEETSFERKRDAEGIKAKSTNSTITVNPKGVGQYTVNFFCKFILCSNHLRMLYMTRYDERYWVIRVNKPKRVINKMFEMMKAEIPAFLHYLETRKMATKDESRMWFHPSLIMTDQFQEMVEVNEPTDAADLRLTLDEWFTQFPEENEIRLPLGYVSKVLLGKKIQNNWMREILKLHLGVDLMRNDEGTAINTNGKFKQYVFDEQTGDTEYKEYSWKGRPYVFKREQFAKQKVIQDITQETSNKRPSDDWDITSEEFTPDIQFNNMPPLVPPTNIQK